MEVKITSRHIDRLLLDPNNYRFLDHLNYNEVEESKAEDIKIQQRTFNFIVGKGNENISDLILSFKKNGFLNIDQIQVKPVGEYFIVLEGNRRVATLKYLYEEWKKGNDIGLVDEKIFKSISVVSNVDEDPRNHLITMGLHHISGKKRWSPVNQAQLISDLRNKYSMSETEICESLGITKTILRRTIRTLRLIEHYKQSDYGDQFESNMYSIFEEILKKREIKDWLQWNDSEYKAVNTSNLDKIFSWISTEEDIVRDDEDEDDVLINKMEPIITKSTEIRELAKFINDSSALETMEQTRSITGGFTSSNYLCEARISNALETLDKECITVFRYSDLLQNSHYSAIMKLRDKFDKLIPSSYAKISETEANVTYLDRGSVKFQDFTIEDYRCLKHITIKKLSRINIFVGINNSGKTSLLESIFLTTQLNNLNKILELEKYRSRFKDELNSKWLNRNFANEIRIKSKYNNKDIDLHIVKKPTDNREIDKTKYLTSIKINSTFDNHLYESEMHLFEGKDSILNYSTLNSICEASFTSAFRYNKEKLKQAHAFAVEYKYMDIVLDFIRENLNSNINNIELVNDGEPIFLVNTSLSDKSIDITKYGEGLQRIFEIALMLIYCKDGILCIDEIDSAIHKSLLVKFTDFVNMLSEKFNVQVFLSTHSKECIDAFVSSENNDSIMAYSLKEINGEIMCQYIEASRLATLVENLNLDIR